MTIMAVSVPFLRILVVEARSASVNRHHFVPRLKIPVEPDDEKGLVLRGGGSEKKGAAMFAADIA